MIKRKIDSCESTDYIIEPNYHFIQTNTNYDKLNKIIERISNYDNPDKSNILQKSIINQLPHTQKIKKDKLNIIEKKEQLNEMEMSEEIVEGTEKCIDYNLDKKIFITMKGYYVRFYNIRAKKKTFSLNCAVKGCHGSGTFFLETKDFVGKCNHNKSHNRHLFYNNNKRDLIKTLTEKQKLIKDALRNKIFYLFLGVVNFSFITSNFCWHS